MKFSGAPRSEGRDSVKTAVSGGTRTHNLRIAFGSTARSPTRYPLRHGDVLGQTEQRYLDNISFPAKSALIRGASSQ